MNTQTKKTFNQILSENKIIRLSKNYPSRQEKEEAKTKNPGFRVYQDLSWAEETELFHIWLNQWFSVSLETINENQKIVLNGKYTFNARNSSFPYLCLYNKESIYLKNRYSVDCWRKENPRPSDINFNIKNPNLLQKKITEYCNWLDAELAQEIALKAKEDKGEIDAQEYAKNISESLKLPLKGYYGNDDDKEKEITHEFFSIVFNSDCPSFDLKLYDYKMTKEQKIELCKFLKSMAPEYVAPKRYTKKELEEIEA